MRPSLLFLAGSAAALPRGVDVSKTVEGRAVGVTADDLDRFSYFGEYAAATFCNYEAEPDSLVTCSGDACPTVMANRAKILLSLNHNTTTNTAGYIAVDDVKKIIVLAFRGSVTARNWITDLTFAFTSCEYASNCKIHTGFDKGWRQVRDQVLPALASAKATTGYRVVVTGHSLGAAVATVAGAAIRESGIEPAADIYTYGSPRVGNAVLADYITAQPGAEYRLTHENDVVPRLPPLFIGYRHTSPEYWLNGGDSTSFKYGLENIKVCQGNAAPDCINSVIGFAPEAHLYYLHKMAGCKAPGLSMRDTDAPEISDEELKTRLDMWAAMDREFLANLPANETAA
ncbi:hypothetical protein RB595_007386 [Gaeumannomyces hyphopodioides]